MQSFVDGNLARDPAPPVRPMPQPGASYPWMDPPTKLPLGLVCPGINVRGERDGLGSSTIDLYLGVSHLPAPPEEEETKHAKYWGGKGAERT